MPRLPTGLIGVWRIRYPDNQKKHGVVSLSRVPDGAAYSAVSSVFRDDKLIEKRNGVVLPIGDAQLLFDWTLQTWQVTPYGSGVMHAGGVTRLTLVRNGALWLEGSTQRLSKRPEPVIWERASASPEDARTK